MWLYKSKTDKLAWKVSTFQIRNIWCQRSEYKFESPQFFATKNEEKCLGPPNGKHILRYAFFFKHHAMFTISLTLSIFLKKGLIAGNKRMWWQLSHPCGLFSYWRFLVRLKVPLIIYELKYFNVGVASSRKCKNIFPAGQNLPLMS